MSGRTHAHREIELRSMSFVKICSKFCFRASTRSRSKKGADVETSQQKTPVKKQRSESPDMFLTPSKSEISEKQSSYAGSHGDESEIDLTLSQKSLDLESYVYFVFCPSLIALFEQAFNYMYKKD